MRILATLLLVALTLAATSFSPEGPADEAIAYSDELLVQIAVSDLDAACSFYGEVLDLTLESRNEALKWAKFLLPTGARLGVGQQDEARGSGSVSINISVRDIAAARRTLEARGVTFDGPTLVIPGVVQLATFADPDGNRIRLAGAP